VRGVNPAVGAGSALKSVRVTRVGRYCRRLGAISAIDDRLVARDGGFVTFLVKSRATFNASRYGALA